MHVRGAFDLSDLRRAFLERFGRTYEKICKKINP
jgi:hypothetical protein